MGHLWRRNRARLHVRRLGHDEVETLADLDALDRPPKQLAVEQRKDLDSLGAHVGQHPLKAILEDEFAESLRDAGSGRRLQQARLRHHASKHQLLHRDLRQPRILRIQGVEQQGMSADLVPENRVG